MFFVHLERGAAQEVTQAASTTQVSGAPVRVVQAIDEKQLTTLKGNTHPLARAEFDQGLVPDSQPMNRMLLLLQRSPEQEAALRQLLDDQQSKSSSSFHKWLTPEEFGSQFGPSDADVQTIRQWLVSQGFTNISIGPGRSVIEFSGNAGHVRSGFHTEIHRFHIDAEDRVANSADPQIPVALAPVVAGIVSLHNFPRKSHARILGRFRREAGKHGVTPLITFPNPFNGSTFYGMGPGDFATIYNSKPLIVAGNDGTGQTIAIVGETNINVKDVQDFRSMFGLPANFDASNIILNGEDPGITFTDEEGEADLDIEWSGATAPGATIKYVLSASTSASNGVDLSALYIIEHNLAGVMSESYGECEAGLGTAGNGFYNALWQQAAAQGITVVVSSGDGGSAGCDNFNIQQTATHGIAVSGLASTPFNISLGGTDFDEVNQWTQFWSTTNDATGNSALKYIPEIPWNENCAQISLTGCGASAPQGLLNLIAGSGGPSTLYAKPSWQMGVNGMPNDNHRDQPDISLLASPGFNGTGYIYCQSDENPSGIHTGCDITHLPAFVDFDIIGGTSASAPAFAGIMALVNQKQATSSSPAPRQGNANYILYALAKKSGASCVSSTTEASTCIFNDVTKGNSFLPTGLPGLGTNSVPCKGGTPNCSVATAASNGVLIDPAHPGIEAWSVGTGYDMVTGLGSVNVNNLVNAWSTVSTVPTNTTLSLAPTTGITHGMGSATVNISVTPNIGTGVAAGQVVLIAGFPDGSSRGLDQFTLTNGAVASATTQNLPGGTFSVVAHYAGDGSNAPSDSAPVQMTVAAEPSKTFAHLIHFDINVNPTNFAATGGTYGDGYNIFRIDVGDGGSTVSPTAGFTSKCLSGVTNCPSGTVTISSTGSPLAVNSFPLNNIGYAELDHALHPGSYTLSASYPGDSSYGASTASASFIINLAPTTLSTGVGSGPISSQTQFATNVITTSNGIAPTGTFQFFVDGAPFGSPTLVYESNGYVPGGNPPNYAWADSQFSAYVTTAGTHTAYAQYSGDASYAAATSPTVSFTMSKGMPAILSWGASPNQINLGQQTTLMAQIGGGAPTVPITGTVAFFDGTNQLTGNVVYSTLGNAGLQASMPYSPTTSGAHQITATYSGDANYLSVSTPIAATLTVIGPDFSITSSGATTQTVAAGATATFANAISVGSMNGFSSSVNVTCSVLAKATSCAVNPNTIATFPGSATVTVTTTARGLMPPTFRPPRLYWPIPIYLVLIAAMLIAILLAVRARRFRLAFAIPAATLAVLIVFHSSGCGGGGSSPPPPPPPPQGTPAGSYTITVTATSGNLTHTTTLTLVVN